MAQLPMDQAYAKLQSIDGDDYYIRKLPILLTSKAKKSFYKNRYGLQCLGLTTGEGSDLFALISYDCRQRRFRLTAFADLLVNGLKAPKSPVGSVLVGELLSGRTSTVEDERSIPLDDLSLLIIEREHGNISIFYFTVPNLNIQKFEPSQAIEKSPPPPKEKPTADKNLLNRWTADDREQLKKLILQYGYGRWKQLQRSSTLIGGKLESKSYQEIKAFANSFIRSLGQSLPEEQTELKVFLQNLIEETPDDLYVPPNQKDWDQQILLSQRSVQYTKRLQLLHRVKTLVKKFKEESAKNLPEGTRVNWETLLNFIPNPLLYGQRPAIWWVKKHDIDLILGVYKYGYANYSAIKAAREYCFAELDRADKYNDFPSADNLTRRLKKLMQTINKIEQNEGKIDFEDEGGSSEEEEKNWSDPEKRVLFKLLTDFGIPLTADGRSNWTEIRQRMKALVKDFTKNIGQIEKMVSKIRFNCQEILPEDPKPTTQPSDGRFFITRQAALKFSTNLNMLSFLRKSVMSNEQELFHSNVEDIKLRHAGLKQPDAAFIDNYDPGVSDLNLLIHVARNGFGSCSNPKLNEQKVFNRIEWLCEVFNQLKDKNDRKKKYKNWNDEPKKRTKFELNRDKQGNIMFPININPSLRLLAIGRICTLPNYHSEHNLFPIGYISVRMHASMFTKGVRCNYTCEILQGQGKPIYKVTSEEEPHRPIIRDSSTGCWVYICQRVNQLQEVKKDKVTISGTERFGLLEPNVTRLLEDLSDAEKCSKYKFKYKQIGDGQSEVAG